MSREGVLIPVIGTGVAVAIAKDWLRTAWSALYNLTHTGSGATDPFSNAGLLDFVPVGTGGDAAYGQSAGLPLLKLGGTINNNIFTPSDTRIPTFTCAAVTSQQGDVGPGACGVPSNILWNIYAMLGLLDLNNAPQTPAAGAAGGRIGGFTQ